MPPPAHTPVAAPRAAPPPPTLPSELLDLVSSLGRNLSDLEGHQLPELAACRDRGLHEDLSGGVRREMGGVRRGLEELKLQVDDLLKSRDRRAGADHVVAIQLRLDSVTKLYRQAVIASKRLIDSAGGASSSLSSSLGAGSSFGAGREMRDELLSSSLGPGGKRTAPGGGLLGKKKEETSEDDALMSATSDVTEGLRRTLQLMQQEVDRSQVSNELLEAQTATLSLTSEQYSLFSTLLTTSKALITSLERADLLDRLILLAALLLFGLVCAWVIKRRVVDRGLKVAKVVGGVVGLGGGKGKEEAREVMKRGVESVVGEAAAVTTAIVSAVKVAQSVVTSRASSIAQSASAIPFRRPPPRAGRHGHGHGGHKHPHAYGHGQEDTLDHLAGAHHHGAYGGQGQVIAAANSSIAVEPEEPEQEKVAEELPTQQELAVEELAEPVVEKPVVPSQASEPDQPEVVLPPPAAITAPSSTITDHIPSEFPESTPSHQAGSEEPKEEVHQNPVATPSPSHAVVSEELEHQPEAQAEPEFDSPTPTETSSASTSPSSVTAVASSAEQSSPTPAPSPPAIVDPIPTATVEPEAKATPIASRVSSSLESFIERVVPTPVVEFVSSVAEPLLPTPTPTAVVEQEESDEEQAEPIASAISSSLESIVERVVPMPVVEFVSSIREERLPSSSATAEEQEPIATRLSSSVESTIATPVASVISSILPSATSSFAEPQSTPTPADQEEYSPPSDSELGVGPEKVMQVFSNLTRAVPYEQEEVVEEHETGEVEEKVFKPMESFRPATPDLEDVQRVIEEQRVEASPSSIAVPPASAESLSSPTDLPPTPTSPLASPTPQSATQQPYVDAEGGVWTAMTGPIPTDPALWRDGLVGGARPSPTALSPLQRLRNEKAARDARRERVMEDFTAFTEHQELVAEGWIGQMVEGEWMWKWGGKGPNPALAQEHEHEEYEDEEDDDVEYDDEELDLENLSAEELEELRLIDLEDAMEHQNDTDTDSAPPPAPAPEFTAPVAVEEHLKATETPAPVPLPPYDPPVEEPTSVSTTIIVKPSAEPHVPPPMPAASPAPDSVPRDIRVEILGADEGNRITPGHVGFAPPSEIRVEPTPVAEPVAEESVSSREDPSPAASPSTTQDALNVPNVHSTTASVEFPSATATPSPSPVKSTLSPSSVDEEQAVDPSLDQRDLVEEDMLEGVGEVDSGTMTVDQVLDSAEGSVELPEEVLEVLDEEGEWDEEEEPEPAANIAEEIPSPSPSPSPSVVSPATPTPTPSAEPQVVEEDVVVPNIEGDEEMDGEELEFGDDVFLDEGDEEYEEQTEQQATRDEL